MKYGSPAVTNTLSAGPVKIDVLANASEWRNTGITVSSGHTYSVSASGQWRTHPVCRYVGPDGANAYGGLCLALTIRKFVQSETHPTLVAKISQTGTPFAIGAQESFTAEQDGILFLSINEHHNASVNNDGKVTVEIAEHLTGSGRATATATPPAPVNTADSLGISLSNVAVAVSAKLAHVNGYADWYLGNGESGGHEQLDKTSTIRRELDLSNSTGGLPVKLDVDLAEFTDVIDSEIDASYRLTMHYRLTDSDGTELLSDTVTANGSATLNDAFFGDERVRLAAKRAFIANVKKFRARLASQMKYALKQYQSRAQTVARAPSLGETLSTLSYGAALTQGSETGSGFYAYEDELNFNALDTVAFDPTAGHLTLAGHFDPEYIGPRIPYLQHLAVLLENPEPEFSLDWTPESERAMDRFLATMDDERSMVGSLNLDKEWFNRNGAITEHGKQMVKMLGIEPVENGRAPGWLGVNIRNPKSGEENAVVVTGVRPGSPADRAGIRTGEHLMFIDDNQPRHVRAFIRRIRHAGAGKTVRITADRPSSLAHFNVILEAGPDPWAGFNREEMIARLLRNDGNNQGANVVEAIEEMQLALGGPKEQEALITLYFATASVAYGFEEAGKRYNQYDANVRSGRMTRRQAAEQTMRDVLKGIEAAFRAPLGTLLNQFDRDVARGSSASKAFGIAWENSDKLLKPLVERTSRRALRQQKEVVMSVSDVAEKTGVSPIVKPTYRGVPANTQLSRVLYQADYLGKSLVLSPALANYVPGFKTEYSYFADAGDPGASSGLDRRLWFTIDKLKLGQSKDGNVLEFRDVAMRINIGPERGQPSRVELDYSNLLTSLYDSLSRIMPPLHELREAAKLAAAAKWLRSKSRRFRLPRDGRMWWRGPAEVPALVRLVWSPQRTKVAVTAPGGASLQIPGVPPIGPLEAKVPILGYPVTVDGATVNLSVLDEARPVIREASIPSNAEVIDLSQISPAQWIGVPSITALPRKRITRTVPPVPQPLGFKALASRGGTLMRTLKLRLDEAGGACSPEDLQAINEEAAEARRLMDELAFTENIMNAITKKNLDRKAAEAELALYTEELKQNLETAAIDLITRGMLDQYEIDKLKAGARGLDELRQGVDFSLEMKKRLKTKREQFETYQNRLRLLSGTATADDIETRNQLMGKWIDLMGELLENAENIKGNAGSAKALRIGAKAIKKARRDAKLAKSATDIVKIGDALYRKATFDGDSAAAKELHRQYKDRTDALNAALSSPSMKALMAGNPCLSQS